MRRNFQRQKVPGLRRVAGMGAILDHLGDDGIVMRPAVMPANWCDTPGQRRLQPRYCIQAPCPQGPEEVCSAGNRWEVVTQPVTQEFSGQNKSGVLAPLALAAVALTLLT